MTGRGQIVLPFPGLDPVPLASDGPPAVAVVQPEPEPQADTVDHRQIALFSDAAALARDLEHAVASGDFEEATRLREVAVGTYGPAGPSRGFDFLDVLGPDLWTGPAADILERWETANATVPMSRRQRLSLRDGVMRRLLRTHDAAHIASARISTAGHLTAALASLDGPPGAALGRALVRDLLASGHSLEGTSFRHDGAIADILAEDMDPQWLACLGAVKHVWPVPPMNAGDLETFGVSSVDGDAHPGEAFFICLRAARTPGRPDAVLHEARRRMKRLNSSLHAMYMRMP